MELEKEFFKQVDYRDDWEVVGSALGYSLGMSLVEKMVAKLVVVDNYVLFSITNIQYQGKKKAVGIGAFGNVFIFREMQDFRSLLSLQ